MIIATFACGDNTLMLTAAQPKSAGDSVMYQLQMTDLFNGKTYTKVFTGENAAIRAFAAAIVCDEPDLTQDEASLRADPATAPFLC